jgi:HPt (histidine-containing phosphotransfer) domain-containing protein
MPVSDAQSRPIDLAHLATYTGGDAALNAEVLQLFHEQSAQLMGELASVLEARDQVRWHEITHSLKGAARGIGAFAVADAAAIAEPVPLAASSADALKALEELKTRMRAVHLFIEAYLGG